MLKDNNKFLKMKIFFVISMLLEISTFVLATISTVTYVNDWASYLEIIGYIFVCIVLTVKTTKICSSNSRKILVIPAIYLIWNQSYNLYYFVRMVQSSVSYMLGSSGEKLHLLLLNCAPKILIILLLIVVACLLLLSKKQRTSTLVFAGVALIVQIVDKIPPVIRSIPVRLNSSLDDIYSIVSMITNNVANLCMFFILIIFLFITYRNKNTQNTAQAIQVENIE